MTRLAILATEFRDGIEKGATAKILRAGKRTGNLLQVGEDLLCGWLGRCLGQRAEPALQKSGLGYPKILLRSLW